MLELTQPHVDKILNQAQQALPERCCGLLIGHCDGQVWKVVDVMPTRNASLECKKSTFQMETKDRIDAEQVALKSELQVIGFYCSARGAKDEIFEQDVKKTQEYELGEPWIDPYFAYLSLFLGENDNFRLEAFQVVQGKPTEFKISLKA